MADKKMSHPERVERAVKQFKVSPELVKVALENMDEKLRERNRPQHILGTKEARHHVRMLRDAARKTKAYTLSEKLPRTLCALFVASEIPEVLDSLEKTCREVLSFSQTPKRQDGYAKLLAVEEAVLIPGGPASAKQLIALAAILYGTGDAADVRRAFRTLRERLTAVEERLTAEIAARKATD